MLRNEIFCVTGNKRIIHITRPIFWKRKGKLQYLEPKNEIHFRIQNISDRNTTLFVLKLKELKFKVTS
jgi:hypothetical protein